MKDFKKVAGFFVVAIRDLQYSAELESFLKEYPVGGLGLFNSPHDSADYIWNDPEAALEATHALSRKARERKLFLSVDQEGGRVARLKSPFIKIPPAEEMASIFVERSSPNRIYDFYRLVAQQLSLSGIHLNFAPVCDLRYEETSSAIGDRSFGGEPAVVIQMVRLFCEAMSSEEVSTTLKHLPGHGPTQFDSHESVAVTLKTEREMLAEDFKVFEECAEFANAIMPGHIAYMDSPDRIISLDKAHLETLRKKLPEGLRWISDDLALMKAVSSRDPWIRCFDLNYDHMLLCGDLDQAAKAIEATIRHAEKTVTDTKEQLALEMRIQHSRESFQPSRPLLEFDRWKTSIRNSSEQAQEILEEIRIS